MTTKRTRKTANVESSYPEVSIRKNKASEVVIPSNAERIAVNLKDYEPDENNVLEVRTVSGNVFKNLLDTLKVVLHEANLVFTEKGLKLASVDAHQFAAVHLQMDFTAFQYYHIKQKQVLGVDIDVLHRSMKTNKFNDMMCFIVRKDERHILEIIYENSVKRTRVVDRIELKSLQECRIQDGILYRPPAELDAASFQSICREMSVASFGASYLEIESTGGEIMFRNKDGSTKREVIIQLPESDDKYTEEDRAIGVFKLGFLKSFAKASNLSNKVCIYLQTGDPLILEYNVSNFGTLRYLLIPESEQNSDNEDE